jgi:DNA-binding transcriptional LysR family regulator
LQRYPEVRIELDLTNRMVDLVEEGVDLAIRIGDIHNDDLVAKYLCPYNMVICAAPDYLAQHGTPQTPADLVDHLCLSHTVWTARNEWRLPGVEGEVRWKRDAVLRCNDGYGLRMAARAGRGCCCSRRCWWRKSWQAAGWFGCWSRSRPRRGRCIYCGVRICGRCLS